MDIDHDLVLVEEFDAIAIEVNSLDAPLTPSKEREEQYPAKKHAKKVAKELGVDKGLIYLPGLPSQTFEDSDMAPAFRQRRYFYYMSGVDFPDAIVTYDIATDKLILWIPYMDPRQALYLGGVPSKEECLHRYDVDECDYASLASRYVSRHLSLHPGTTLYVLHENQAPPVDRRRGMLNIDHGRLLRAMDAARVIKTPYEIRAIRKANAISSAAHCLVLTKLKGLATEAEIEAVFVASCLARGAKHQAYPVIAGSGANAATLHYDANDEPLAGRQLVVLDAGAEWRCYASDITRTIPVEGVFTAEGRAVYGVVDRMQRACIERVREGCPYRSLQAVAQRVAVVELMKLGILHGVDAEDILRAGTVAAFFPHGLGHHVGLEVHDVWSRNLLLSVAGGPARELCESGPAAPLKVSRGKRLFADCEFYAALSREQEHFGEEEDAMREAMGPGGVLKENMIVTIEPGIYFNRAFIEAFIEDQPKRSKYIDKKVLEKYYPVGGVRIEDDVLVLKDGFEVISTAPKGDEALRIINQGY